MFYVCTICMMKKGNLSKLKPQHMIIVQVAVAPFVDIVELKKLAMTVCLSCTQWIKNFQEMLIPGVTNMINLNRRFNTSSRLEWSYMSLPDVIDNNSNVFLPIANQEIVCTTDTHATNKETPLLKTPAPQNCPTPLPKRVFIKRHCIISPQLGVPNTIEDRRQLLDKGNDDHGYSVKVPVPKSVKILARSVEMVDHIDKGHGNENNMAMPTPNIEKSSKDGMELKNTSKSVDVQRTKLNRQLYKAIQLAVKSKTISEKFDINQYEPESSESALEDVPECPDSESTLSGDSDYDDAESFPNIIFAKAFNGVTEDAPNGDQQKAHIIADPPSEWPCTSEPCLLQQIAKDGDDFEADDEDTPTKEARSQSKKQVKKCTLCYRTFPTIRKVRAHYKRVHVDEGGRKLRKKTRLSRKNKASASHGRECAECGISTHSYRDIAKHFATAKHIARMQWRYQCDICKRKFEFKEGIAEHIQMEHLARETLVCPMCAATFKSARAMHRHAAAHILAETDTQDLEETQSEYRSEQSQNKHTNTCTRDTQNNTTTLKRNRGTDRNSPAQDADNGVQDNTEDHLQEETQSVHPNHSRSQNAHALRKDTDTCTRDTQNDIPTRNNKNPARTRRFNSRKRLRTNKTFDGYLHELPMDTHAPDNTNSAQDITHTPTSVEGYKNEHARTNTNTRTLARTAQNDNHKQNRDQDDDYHLLVRSLHAQVNAYTQDITDNPTQEQGYKNKRAPANNNTDASTAQNDHERPLAPEDDSHELLIHTQAQDNTNTEDIIHTPVQGSTYKRARTNNKTYARTAQDDQEKPLAPDDDSHELLIHKQAQDNTNTEDIIHTPVQGNTYKRGRTNNKTYARTAQDDNSHITIQAQDNTRHRTHTQTNKQRNGTQNKKASGKRTKDVTYSWAQAQSQTHIQEYIHIRHGRVVKRTTRKIRTKRQKPGESDAGRAHLFQHLLV